ncbi:MAG: transposase, partial [Thermodesulfobacteriota bacterium]|nr:transposase [Thermodesulfobacteriota bacterium]
WAEVKALKKAKISQKSDERILGDGDFVERVLASANEAMERKYYLESRGFNLDKVAARVAEVLGTKQENVWAVGKYRHIVYARSLLCYWAVREMGITMSSLALKLNISVSAVSKSTIRGQKLAKAGKYSLMG